MKSVILLLIFFVIVSCEVHETGVEEIPQNNNSPSNFLCLGEVPNATLCPGDSSNLSYFMEKTVTESCTEATVCEYKCNQNFHLYKNKCISNPSPPSTFSLVNPMTNNGTEPRPTVLISGVKPEELVRVFKSNDCSGNPIEEFQVGRGQFSLEFRLKELSTLGHNVFSVNTSRNHVTSDCSNKKLNYTLYGSCLNKIPNSKICPGDNQLLTKNTLSSLTQTCTQAKKCEFTCQENYHPFDGQCVTNAKVPTGLSILGQTSGTLPSATLKVSGVVQGEYVRIYNSNNCSGNYVRQGRVLPGETTIELKTNNISKPGTHVYSTASVKHSKVSACSTAKATYELIEDNNNYSCLGKPPENTKLCYTGSETPKTNLNYTVLATCSNNTTVNTCQLSCMPGYSIKNSQCVKEIIPPPKTNAMVSVWRVPAGNFIELPLVKGYNYDFIVDWGDGTSNTITTYDDPNRKHTYNASADYTVTISGKLEAWDFYPAHNTGQYYIKLPSRNKLIKIESLGDLGWKNLRRAFMGCENLNSFSGGNTSGVTNMSFMFFNAKSIVNIDLSSFDTRNVTDVSYMFSGLRELTSLNLSRFETQNVTSMAGMFHESRKLQNLSLSELFVTDKVTDMSFMFRRTNNLRGVDISGFNTSNVTNMDSMLAETPWLTNDAIRNFRTHNVTNMSKLFLGFTNDSLDLSHFDTRKVTKMTFMFQSARVVSLNLTSFDTSKVSNMGSMFRGADQLVDLSISNTFSIRGMGDDIDKSMSNMFSNTPLLSEQSYSNILIQFDATTVSESRVIGFSDFKASYLPEAAQARQNLLDRGWLIRDGGLSGD